MLQKFRRLSFRTRAAMLVMTSILVVVVAAVLLRPGGVSDAELQRRMEALWHEIRQLAQDGALTPERLDELAARSTAGIDVRTLTPRQLITVYNNVGLTHLDPDGHALSVLASEARHDDYWGAYAATVHFLLLQDRHEPTDVVSSALVRAVTHPALAELFEWDQGGQLFYGLTQTDPQLLRQHRDSLLALQHVITPELPARAAMALPHYIDAIHSADADSDTADRILRRTLEAIDAARTRAIENGDDRQAAVLEQTAAYAATVQASHRIGGQPAPPLNILWSGDPAISSMDDLRGRIIVLNFWATWCGPCIAKFPDLARLVERYRGYPVAILGITSLQGFHITPDRQRIDTRDDAEKELQLMVELIRELNVTWPVVFTEEPVMNPAFGVRGIPYTVILDPDGMVQHSGFSTDFPSLKAKSARIDSILRNSGLPAPAAE